jgi:hypothetical protein
LFAKHQIKNQIESFARELLLDASECEFAFYMLPPLQRDGCSRKGVFHTAEKIVQVNYSSSFPFASSNKIRDQIDQAYKRMLDSQMNIIENAVTQLLRPNCVVISDSKEALNQNILSYILKQFQTMCAAMSLELQKLKIELSGKSAYPYLQAVTQMYRNAKLLYKKISMNALIKQCFAEYMISNGFSEEQAKKTEYLCDLVLLNVLDQIFIQTVYLSNKSDIIECLRFETKVSVVPERIEDLQVKKEGLLRVFKLVNQIELNQRAKIEIAFLVNPEYKIPTEGEEDALSANNEMMKRTISGYLYKLCQSARTADEYIKGANAFTRTHFVLPYYLRYYYDA